MNTRTCTRCHQTKPTSEYPRTNNSHAWCNQCHARHSRQYRSALSPEQRNKQYRANSEWQYAAQLATLDTATQLGSAWTQHEDDFLRNNHKTMTTLELARKLNRSHSAITNRKYKLGLRKTNNYNH